LWLRRQRHLATLPKSALPTNNLSPISTNVTVKAVCYDKEKLMAIDATILWPITKATLLNPTMFSTSTTTSTTASTPTHTTSTPTNNLLSQPCFPLNDSGLVCHYRPGLQQPQCCCYHQDQFASSLNLDTLTMTELDSIATKRRIPLRCLPSFFIIGAQKSASTVLFLHFTFHPNFTVPLTKEAHFFDIIYYSERAENAGNKYLSMYPPTLINQTATTITCDATPSYILRESDVERLHRLLPHGPLIVILRDPVDRAYSEYQMKVRNVDRIMKQY